MVLVMVWYSSIVFEELICWLCLFFWICIELCNLERLISLWIVLVRLVLLSIWGWIFWMVVWSVVIVCLVFFCVIVMVVRVFGLLVDVSCVVVSVSCVVVRYCCILLWSFCLMCFCLFENEFVSILWDCWRLLMVVCVMVRSVYIVMDNLERI